MLLRVMVFKLYLKPSFSHVHSSVDSFTVTCHGFRSNANKKYRILLASDSSNLIPKCVYSLQNSFSENDAERKCHESHDHS